VTSIAVEDVPTVTSPDEIDIVVAIEGVEAGIEVHEPRIGLKVSDRRMKIQIADGEHVRAVIVVSNVVDHNVEAVRPIVYTELIDDRASGDIPEGSAAI